MNAAGSRPSSSVNDDRPCAYGYNVSSPRWIGSESIGSFIPGASIEAAARGGGYILAPTNSHPDISVERLRWMLEAVDKYGKYQ